jgi:hypothetical protein
MGGAPLSTLPLQRTAAPHWGTGFKPVPARKRGTSEPGIHRPRRGQWWGAAGTPRRPFRAPNLVRIPRPYEGSAGMQATRPRSEREAPINVPFADVSYYE